MEAECSRDDEGGEVVPVIRPTVARDLPAFNPWVNDNGEFSVPRYDDRHEVPEGEEPLLDPRWPAFNACMEARGHKLVAQSEVFTQEHLDTLLARVNEAMPDRVANKRTPPSELTGIAGDFVACADEELARPLAP